MSRSRRAVPPTGRLAAAAAAAVLGLIPAVAACDVGADAPTLEYHPQSAGVDTAVHGIEIRDAFVLGAPAGPLAAGQSAGVFLALYNDGGPDTLLSVTAPGTAKAAALPSGGIRLGSGQAVYLTGPKPRIILTGLTHSLSGGQAIHVTFAFLNAGSITLDLPVIPRTDDYATFSPAPPPTPTTATRKRHAISAASPTATAPATAGATASPTATPSATP